VFNILTGGFFILPTRRSEEEESAQERMSIVYNNMITGGSYVHPCILDPKLCREGLHEITPRRTLLSINSQDRNSVWFGPNNTSITNSFTNDNSFTYRFAPLSQVRRIHLVSTEIPQTEYIVSDANDNNHFEFLTTDSKTVRVTIPDGSYTGASMAAELQSLMNAGAVAAGSTNTFTVVFDQDSAKMSFTNSVNSTWYVLRTTGTSGGAGVAASFPTEEIYYNVGLSQTKLAQTTDLKSTSAGVVTGSYIVQLQGENYIYLQLPQYGTMKTSEGLTGIFAKLLFAGDPGAIIFQTFVSQDVIFSNPVTKLDHLDINFIKRNGELYDFNGVPVSFTLEIEHHV